MNAHLIRLYSFLSMVCFENNDLLGAQRSPLDSLESHSLLSSTTHFHDGTERETAMASASQLILNVLEGIRPRKSVSFSSVPDVLGEGFATKPLLEESIYNQSFIRNNDIDILLQYKHDRDLFRKQGSQENLTWLCTQVERHLRKLQPQKWASIPSIWNLEDKESSLRGQLWETNDLSGYLKAMIQSTKEAIPKKMPIEPRNPALSRQKPFKPLSDIKVLPIAPQSNSQITPPPRTPKTPQFHTRRLPQDYSKAEEKPSRKQSIITPSQKLSPTSGSSRPRFFKEEDSLPSLISSLTQKQSPWEWSQVLPQSPSKIRSLKKVAEFSHRSGPDQPIDDPFPFPVFRAAPLKNTKR